MGRIVTAMTRDGSARAVVADMRDVVAEAMRIHSASPTAAAALGRTLTAASIMGYMLGGDGKLLTLRFNGDGAGGSIVVSADPDGSVRGFIQNPGCDLPLRADGKLDVAGCVGKGNMYVLRDTGSGEPYVGVAPIVSGEIAEDIASYFAVSEQIPTVCALGVLVGRDLGCDAAGGALIQLLPFADPEISSIIEKNASSAPPVTEMLRRMTAEDMLGVYLAGIEYDTVGTASCGYVCGCSRQRTDRALISLGRKELEDMISEDRDTDLVCQFCGKKYVYTTDELRKLLTEAK